MDFYLYGVPCVITCSYNLDAPCGDFNWIGKNRKARKTLGVE